MRRENAGVHLPGQRHQAARDHTVLRQLRACRAGRRHPDRVQARDIDGDAGQRRHPAGQFVRSIRRAQQAAAGRAVGAAPRIKRAGIKKAR